MEAEDDDLRGEEPARDVAALRRETGTRARPWCSHQIWEIWRAIRNVPQTS